MHEKSAGLIVKHHGRYLLLHYAGGHWDFPKGHIEKGETKEEAAMRELKEETGLSAKIIPGFEETIEYMFKKGGKLIKKSVVFFAAIATEKEIVLSSEHQGFKWLGFDDAVKQATYQNAKEVLRNAHEWFNAKES